MSLRQPRVVRITTHPYHLWNFMEGQARFLRERGFDVHAVSAPGPLLDKFAAREQVPVHEVPMHRPIAPMADLKSLRHLSRLLSELQPDIIHTTTPKAGLLGMLAGEWCRAPVKIYQAAGLRWWTLSGATRKIVMTAQRTALSRADVVLCVSPSVRHAILDRRLARPERTKVLGWGHDNGIDVDGKFHPDRIGPALRGATRDTLGIPEDAVVLGFLGRLVRDKGIEELAEAWMQVRDELPSLHLLLVGEFEEDDPVTPQTRELLSNDPRVHFPGWVDDVVPMYAAMDVCVLPSHREGLPTIALEAGALQIPLITTDAIGCVDVVENGVTGTQICVGDAEALAETIREYSANPHLRRQHGVAAREYIHARFRHEVVWEAVYEEYTRLLAEKALPLPHFGTAAAANPGDSGD